ncbi:uncharacterized protein LOC108114287 [Drosophila eugracilis]|uniref:uncharacterized protein LOC108114287 n=1 Tax=Drosophila eugracilis TaxID=29029 RepID=UPI0007E73AFA|nr:uncharacterized protein LOC108114287 [Drosophila eugracilis]
MDYPVKAILFSLLVISHCTSGYVHDRHEIVKRFVNLTEVDRGLGGALSLILSPIAKLAERANLDIPVISNFRPKEN